MLGTKAPHRLVFSRHLTFSKPNNLAVLLGDRRRRHRRHQEHLTLTEKLLSLLRQCESKNAVRQIHAQMLLNSIRKPNFLLLKIITDIKDFKYASALFTNISAPNDYAFNIMIRGLTTTWQKPDLAIHLYYQMKFLGLKPNNFTYPFLFISCGNLSELNHGKVAHCMVFKIGLDGDCHVSHSLITMYARCGELGGARKVFDEILAKDLVSWNSMISGYSKMGFSREAAGLFGKMREEGFEPDEMTLVSVLAACGDLGDLGLGKWVEGFVSERKMVVNSYLGSALIGMYAKCGDLLSARRVFDAMQKRDNVTWNAMINGYAQNGASSEAIVLFNSMKDAGLSPDVITMVGVLSACASASIGALDLGKSVEKYATQRGLHHNVYVGSALIDMYAKCGSLDNALRVFENMPHKNEVTWNSMISALAFHGRPKEALLLFRRMSEGDSSPQPSDVTFVGLLSACVHAGLVDEGRQLFNLMSSSYGLVPKLEHYSCMVDLLARAGLLQEAWEIIQKMPGEPDKITLGSFLGACQKSKNVDISEQAIQLLLEVEPFNSWNYVISSRIYANLRRWDESAKMRVLMRQRGITKTAGRSWIEIEAQVYEFHAGDDLTDCSIDLYHLLNEEMKKKGYVSELAWI